MIIPVTIHTMIDRLPNRTITAAVIFTKGEVCPKLKIVYSNSKQTLQG